MRPDTDIEAFAETLAAQLEQRVDDVAYDPALTQRILADVQAPRITPRKLCKAFMPKLIPVIAASFMLVAGIWIWHRLDPASDFAARRTLAQTQRLTGLWAPHSASAHYIPALTAIATQTLAEEPELYQRQIQVALAAIIDAQNTDGSFGKATEADAYTHAIITRTLLRFANTPETKQAIDKAITYTVATQNRDGSWGAGTTTLTNWNLQNLSQYQQQSKNKLLSTSCAKARYWLAHCPPDSQPRPLTRWQALTTQFLTTPCAVL